MTCHCATAAVQTPFYHVIRLSGIYILYVAVVRTLLLRNYPKHVSSDIPNNYLCHIVRQVPTSDTKWVGVIML
jgi:hypothetical protein